MLSVTVIVVALSLMCAAARLADPLFVCRSPLEPATERLLVPQVGQDITPIPVVGFGVTTIGKLAVRLTLELLLPPLLAVLLLTSKTVNVPAPNVGVIVKY